MLFKNGEYMIEKVIVYFILLKTEFISFEQFGKYIDEQFLNDIHNSLLLELEFCSDNTDEMLDSINEYLYVNKISLNYNEFGKCLFDKLEEIYYNDKTDIADFGCKAYKAWTLLPVGINRTNPFFVLSYAGDCLSYGDEAQTRKLYEETFAVQWEDYEQS